MEGRVYIYTLANPITDEVKYIGKSTNPKKRYANHLSLKMRRHTSNWIQSLRSVGLKPKLEILDECSESNWSSTEQYWIEQFRQWGFNLTNVTKGGGSNARDFSKLKELGPWNKGKKMSTEFCLKIKESRKTYDHSWKIGKKQSKTTIKKRVDHFRGANSSNSKLTEEQVLEIRNSTETNIILAAKHGISLRGIYRVKAKEVYKD